MNKPIEVAQSHLSTLQNQAYFIRDKLIEAHIIYENQIDEDKWLSIFAKSLHHQDWEQLKLSTIKNRDTLNFITFSKQTLEPIANNLKAGLGRIDIDIDDLLSIILNSCSEVELTAMGETKDSIPRLPQAPTSYILELGPDSQYGTDFLTWFWTYRQCKTSWIAKRYGEHMKSARKGLSKAEIKNRCLDVYPNSGVQIKSIIEQLIKGGYCEYIDENSLRLTERGYSYMAMRLTDDFDEEWQQWWNEFQLYFNRIPYRCIDDNWDRYINLFSKGIPPENAAQTFQWGMCYQDAHEEIKTAIQAQLGVELSDFPKERVMIFTPLVYFTPNLTSLPLSDIQFDIDAPEWAIPASKFKTKRYWPNKCYVASYLEITPSHRGWYSLIPDDVQQFDITYRWNSKSGAFKTIIHKMSYHLEPDLRLPENWLYGSEAQYYRPKNDETKEYSFNSFFCLTHGETMSMDEIAQIDRVQSGIMSIEVNDTHVNIDEERQLVASNSYECVGIRYS